MLWPVVQMNAEARSAHSACRWLFFHVLHWWFETMWKHGITLSTEMGWDESGRWDIVTDKSSPSMNTYTVQYMTNNITDTCWSNGGRRSLSLHVHVDCGSFQLLAKSVGGDRKQLSQLTLPGIHCAQTQAMAPSLCQRDIKYNNCLSALHHPASHQLKGNTPPERQETFLRPPLIKPDTLSIPFPCVNAGCLIGIWADSG